MQDPRHMDRQRNRGGTKQRDIRMERQTDRPPAGPKAHGQTEKERTETEGQRQTSGRTQGTWTDKRERGGQKQRDRYRDRDGQTDLMQDPRQRASQFQTLVDVEDQVGFIVETMLSLVVIVPEEQLVYLGQISHVLDPVNPISSRLHIMLNVTGAHLRVKACDLDQLPA